MPTTDQDIRALAYLAKRLREETHGANKWDEAGVLAVVSKLAGRNLAVTIEQVTRHAADPEAKTPGAINRPFVPDAPKPEVPRPPKPSEACADCGRREQDHAGEWTGDHAFVPLGRAAKGRTTVGADVAREALAALRNGLCSHGVPHATCADHDPRRQPAEQETGTA